jgi:O-methyltransferase involved in polyketide biosynthesis
VPSDLARVGVTAKLAAYYRQFSDLPFAKEAAALVGAGEAFDALVQAHHLEPEKLSFYAPMFEARYKSISELARKSGAKQLLELASGYSLRGLDLTRDPAFRYVEVDLADVVQQKARLLEALRRAHGIPVAPGHRLATADVLDLAQLRSAADQLRRDEPVLILCEGLIGYLTRDESERLAENVRSVLSEFHGGTWFTPDFSFKADARDLPPQRKRLREAVTGLTERQLDASAFEDERDLADFLDRHGFDFTVVRQVDETPSFSTIAALGLSPDLVERLRPVLKVYAMKLRT